MKRVLLILAGLAVFAVDSQACHLFRRGRCSSANGATCTQAAATYQPVRGAIRAAVPPTFSGGCSGETCPR